MNVETLFISAFPQIVSLLATFYTLRQEAGLNDFDINEFKEWLNDSQNQHALRIIEEHKQLEQNLSQFMQANHDENLQQLNRLMALMTDVAQNMKGIQILTSSLATYQTALSEQAIDVLRQFVESGSLKMSHLQINLPEYFENLFCFEEGVEVKYDEPRFIEDDIDNLVKFGLIAKHYSSKGNPIYKITRKAVNFIESLDSKKN